MFATFLFTACYYDKEEELYPQLGSKACDTTNVTYSRSIAPIISDNCLNCHSNSSPSGNIKLGSYSDVFGNLNKIMPSINYTSSHPMPQSGQLDSCSLKQFYIWKRNGALNN